MRETEDFTNYPYAAAEGWVEWDKGVPPKCVSATVDYRDRGRTAGYFTANTKDINWGEVVAYRSPAWGVAP